MSDSLNSRVARFEANEANVDAWAKGGPTASVDFGGGPVRSPAKLIADNQASIDAQLNLAGNLSSTATGKGDEMLAVLQPFTGAVPRTQHDKNADSVIIEEFGGGVGVADNLSAMQIALASGAKVITLREGNYSFSAGFVIPDGVTVRGRSMIAGKTPGGTILTFANATSVCVDITAGSNQTARLEDVVVTRTGTPPAGSTGVRANNGYNVRLHRVYSHNHARLYSFIGNNVTGLGAMMYDCNGHNFTEDCFYIDSWAELRVIGGRFGANVSGEAVGNSFIKVMGTGVHNVGTGPNTIVFSQCQFNQGTQGPNYWIDFEQLTNNPAGVFGFDSCHIENIKVAVFKAGAGNTNPNISKFKVTGCTFNNPSLPFFEVGSTTGLNEFQMAANEIYCSAFNMTGFAQLNRVSLVANLISGAATFNGTSGFPNNITVSGTHFYNGASFAGLWDCLMVRANGGITGNTAGQYATGSIVDVQLGGTNYTTLADDRRYAYNSTGAGPQISARSARGTVASPVASNAGDTVHALNGYGHDGTNFGQIAAIKYKVGGTPAAGSTPGQILLATSPVGANSPTDRLLINQSGNFTPVTDNASACGGASNRWTAVYAANGTIQTSDKREKTDITDSALGLGFINTLRPVSYKWISGGKEVVRQVYRDASGEECDPGAEGATAAEIITTDKPGERTHWGLIAQEVKAAADSAGVDFGGWVLTSMDDPEGRQALRYDQFISPLIKAVQELAARVVELEGRA